MKTLLILIFALAPCLFGCAPSEVQTVEELNKFIQEPDNNLVQQVDINDYKFSVAYRPTDLLIYQEVGNDPTSRIVLDNLQKKYSSYYHFILSISKKGKEALNPAEGMGQYRELVQVLSFRMNEFVTMTTSSQDTIPVGDFILNRTYGISQSTDVLFVFNKERGKGRDWVQFNLNEFGLRAGNQRFRFKVSDLESVPRLKFNISKT
jgi:hypothetical protein